MGSLKRLVHEVHRRSMWQVLGIYIVGSWIALQVVDVLMDNFGLPDWFPAFALGLLIVGLPIVMATAFVQEGIGSDGSATPSADPSGVSDGSSADADPSAAVTGSAARAAAPEDRNAVAAHAVAGPPSPERSSDGRRHRLFTWRNALAGGALAFALLGVVTAGYLGLRSLGIGPAGTLVAKGLIEERAPILLAEFGSPERDSLLARAATEAFRIDLSQSQVVRLADPVFVNAALERMGRGPDATLDRELARELAQREGIGAVITGEVTSAGGGYLLAAEVIAASSGQVLASHRETARDSTEILPAIDRLSARLRERIGESLLTLRGDPPLERVSTADLDALRKYSQAIDVLNTQGEEDRAIRLLEEAIAADSGFAMAYRKLGVILGNRGEEPARALEALEKAFEHRDRLTELERYQTMGTYYTDTGREEEAINAYRNALELQPDDYTALNNLGVVMTGRGDFDRAAELFDAAWAADSASPLALRNRGWVETNRGKLDEARATGEVLSARFPHDPLTPHYLGLLAAQERDHDTATAHFTALADRHGTSAFWRAEAERLSSSTSAVAGRVSSARDHLREAMRLAGERGLGGAYLIASGQLAMLDLLLLRRSPPEALAPLDAALERYPFSSLDPLDRPYLEVAGFLAIGGRPGEARELLERHREEVEPVVGPGRGEGGVPHVVEGEIALAEDRLDAAIESFRQGEVHWCPTCTLPRLARAYERAAQIDSAVAAYERYLSTPDFARVGWLGISAGAYGDALNLAPAHERLGQLYDERGNLEKAAEHYARFVELWADADPELQPRVRAAQERLEAIVAERG